MSTIYTTQLLAIYGVPKPEIATQLQVLVEHYRGRIPVPVDHELSARDTILITYADQVQEPGKPHLQTLAEFCEARLRGVVSGIHVLPFYPWSSDDGFSVMDYRQVDPAVGDWAEIERLGRSFRLMFDAVINHASAQGRWFQSFLRGEAPYADYFLRVEGNPDLSRVVRPRPWPLLTEFQTVHGPQQLWTTFSSDQVDLDFHNPAVLIEIFDILLMYAQRGAQFIRLDAIAYLWKEIGTTCIHLPQTHAIIQLLRCVLDEVAPHVRLITETNVPHLENISYFGNGRNEAQLVYNFALPPLVLHTFRTGDASALSNWAQSLRPPSPQTAYFNFLASHDGIGLNPVRGILPGADIDALVEQARRHSGQVSYKSNPDGSQSPYELNISFFDGLSNPNQSEALEVQIARFMAAQAIMLCLPGVPGIYFHSMFGSRSWQAGVEKTGQKRTINREKLGRAALESAMEQPGTLRAQVFNRYRDLLSQRAACSAFHPNGGLEILDLGPGVFAVQRSAPDGSGRALCLHNVTAQELSVVVAGNVEQLEPYQVRWMMNL